MFREEVEDDEENCEDACEGEGEEEEVEEEADEEEEEEGDDHEGVDAVNEVCCFRLRCVSFSSFSLLGVTGFPVSILSTLLMTSAFRGCALKPEMTSFLPA